MSTEGQRAVTDGPEDSAQFADLFDEGAADTGQDQGGSQGGEEGRESEGETEAERQASRDDQGRFARTERQDGKGEDRAARGLRGELTSERGRRQEAEAKAAAVDRQLAEMRAQMDLLIRQGGAGQQSQPAPAAAKEPEQAPDMYTDPEGFREFMVRQAEQRAYARYEQDAQARADFSLQAAQARDPQAFGAAYQAAQSLDPQSKAQVLQRLKIAPDAGSALLDWHRQHQARQEIGSDPVAFRERVRTEVLGNPAELLKDPATRQAILEHLRAEAAQGGSNGGPRTTYTPIPSLNGARGSNSGRGSNASDGSDEGIWDYASGR